MYIVFVLPYLVAIIIILTSTLSGVMIMILIIIMLIAFSLFLKLYKSKRYIISMYYNLNFDLSIFSIVKFKP